MRENFLDKVVKFISPSKAVSRYRARMFLAMADSYVGARLDRRQTKYFMPSRGDADTDVIPHLPLLRERSRDLIRNVPLAVGAINTTVNNVVGTGLKLQAKVNTSILNISEEKAEELNERIENEFNLWAESKHCDRTRTLNFYEIQNLVFRQVLENGDVFILLTRDQDGNIPYSLKLHVIEGDRVCTPDKLLRSKNISGGVEKDENGAPIAYHILTTHPGSGEFKREWIRVEAFGGKTGLKQVIHLYDVLRPGQSRGVPILAPVIETIYQLNKYIEAELMATVVSSMLTVFIKSDSNMGLMSGNNYISETGEIEGTVDRRSSGEIKLGSGAIIELSPGEDIVTVNPQRPNSTFEGFMLAITRMVGTALGIPHEVLIKHFTASYSASRAALLEAWKFFRKKRQWLSTNYCQVVYENWFDEAVALGRINAPGYFSDPLIRKAYTNAIWVGDAPGQIDPEAEVKAAEKRIALGLTTVDEESITFSGVDFKTNYSKIKKEIELFDLAGMRHPATGSQGGGQ